MTKELTVKTEAIDDIPIPFSGTEKMDVAELLDEHFVVDSKWQGLCLGKMMTGWLSHILSESDHRLNQVEGWAEQRVEMLGAAWGGMCEDWILAMTGWHGGLSC